MISVVIKMWEVIASQGSNKTKEKEDEVELGWWLGLCGAGRQKHADEDDARGWAVVVMVVARSSNVFGKRRQGGEG